MNNTLPNEEPKKDNSDKAAFKVVDHVVIKDKSTGKHIINIRG